MTDLGNKEILSKNIKKYMEIKGVDRLAIADSTGISYTTLTDWINGNNYPHIDKIELLANFFGCKKSDLIEEIVWDNNTRLANFKKEVVRVPLLGKVPAGMPMEAIENQYTVDYEEVPADWLNSGKEFFALKITGDSMEPKYSDGDVVVFLRVLDFLSISGKDCCVRINGSDATFKRVTIKDNGILLTPLNIDNTSGFLPQLFTWEEIEKMPVEVLGVAKKLVKYL